MYEVIVTHEGKRSRLEVKGRICWKTKKTAEKHAAEFREKFPNREAWVEKVD